MRLFLWMFFLSVFPCLGQGGLADASLEELLNTRVTSVSKKVQKLSRTAAAVFVLNAEDIRRSGATSLPDLLRMVPGVNVAQINPSTWAISIRGFNSRYSNKVLVLVDGRSVYTPGFSGVYWEQLALPPEDIERIEVIRGPGSSSWGANAMNGVINIITKPAGATPGGMVSATAGSETYAANTLQYGASAGVHGAYRAFASYGHEGGSQLPDGQSVADGWSRVNGGFRSDWNLSSSDGLTLQGEAFANRRRELESGSFLAAPFAEALIGRSNSQGGNLLARWTRKLEGGSEVAVRSYFDTYRRTEFGTREDMRAYDIEFQDHMAVHPRHDLVWGGGFRSSLSKAAGPTVALDPTARTDRLYSGFIEDEISLSTRVWLTLGARLEHNSYIGFTAEPDVRIAWTPSDRYTLWASSSRAIRQPSAADASISARLATFPLDANTIETVHLSGNPDFLAEEARDVEFGYRGQVLSNLFLDVTSFFTSYSHMETLEPGSPRLLPGYPAVVQLPLRYGNFSSALGYGGELAMTWKVSGWWRLSPTYSFLRINTQQGAGSAEGSTIAMTALAPHHTVGFRSSITLPRRFEFDQALAWTGPLNDAAVRGYQRLDIRIARRFGERMEVCLGGRNLLRPGTVEFPDAEGLVATEVQRSIYGRIQWTF